MHAYLNKEGIAAMMHDKVTGIFIFGAGLALLAGCSARPMPPQSFALVTAGRPSAVIVATGNKTVDEDIAFFTNAVRRISGTGPEVRRSRSEVEVKNGENVILFEIEKRPITEEDRYEISFPDERTMRIVGTELSCRWALNALLEAAGAVFCMPGPHGTHWPLAKTLAFVRKPRRATASLRLERDLFQEDLDWQRAMNGKKQKGKFFWHNLYDIFPTKVYGKEPWCSKIMPEKDSKRVCPGSWESRWQPCFASQEGIDEAVRRICEHLRKHPDEKVYSLAVNDLEGYCECAACRKLNGGFEKKSAYVKRFVDHSPSYYQWVNAVVRGVRKEFPDVIFGLLSYCGTIDPPPFKLEDNVVPYLCFDIQQLSDPNARALREKLLAAWAEKATALGIWDYAFGLPGYAVPREYSDEQGLYFGYKNGLCPKMEGFFTEGMISALVSEAKKRYLCYRLAWDTTRSAKEESDRWCRACVGEAAAPHLIAYYDLWKDFWHSEKFRQTSWYKDGSKGVYFSYGSLDYLFALDEATRRRSAELMAAVVAAAEKSGTPDQRKRASYLQHVEDYLAARQVASCLGYANEKGEFAGAADAARYLRDLPKIRAAAQHVVDARKMIVADAKECPSKRVDERLSKFKEYSDGGNTTRLTNKALALCAADTTVDALFRGLYPLAFDPAAKNLAILPDDKADEAAWNLQLRGVGAKRVDSVDGTPRYAYTTRDPKCYWQAALKIVRDGIKPSTPYVCSARVTNPTKRAISVQLQAQTVAGDSLAPSDLGEHNVVLVPPGESRTVAVFTVTHHSKKGVIRIGIVPHGLGDDTVYADNLRLVEVARE